MAPKVETSPLAVGFASKLAPTGHFFGVEHVLIPSKLTLVNGYVQTAADKACKIINMNEYLEKLSEASKILDRSGLTKAGRALVKHGSRPDSTFPKPTGNADVINQVAQTVVDDILHNPRKTITKRYHARFGEIIEIKAPDGGGIRFDSSGNFIGFLEP